MRFTERNIIDRRRRKFLEEGRRILMLMETERFGS
jgi:hypothetical protein